MNMDFYLTENYKVQPSMEPQDVVKQCYQAAFGAEHLLTDLDRARAFFMEEYEPLEPVRGNLYEMISPSFARISLPVWKRAGLSPEWLFQLFVLTASEPSVDGDKLFQEYLHTAGKLIEQGTLPIPSGDWQTYLDHYLESGQGPVHHSPHYRRTVQPAYRIVHNKYLNILPILVKLGILKDIEGSVTGESAHVIAIDGRAASGKTTLSGQLARILDAGVIHMDDFFLPLSLRTTERFQSPGGNIHHERFQSEVIPFLHCQDPFTYQRFDCGTMEFGGIRTVKESPWRIVEGSYSTHPVLSNYGDVTVFTDIGKQAQMERILKRDGEEMAEVFSSKWIPLEEEYFNAFQVRETAHIIISNS